MTHMTGPHQHSETIDGVPGDFPRQQAVVSLSGAQPKLALVEIDGRFYPEGRTPEEVQSQHAMCEDLARQGAAYCTRKIDEGVVVNEGAALDRLYRGLQGKDWCSSEQKVWIVRRVAALQGWAVPTTVPELSKGS